jgi:peptide/nickel transport system ATP-binding protein
MGQVGLPDAWLTRRAEQLSGGERQRCAIARALAAEPKVIVLDEPFSGLDPPLQTEMLELLKKLRDEFGAALLFISHDIRVAGRISDDIAVMHNGQIVECAQTEELLSAPQHPYTQSLLAARG